jgi:GGDEF domain-containing protein
MRNNMSDSGKAALASAVVAAVCIILYIAVLAYGAVVIIGNITERRVLAEQEFRDLADRSVSAAILGFMSQPYQEAVTDTLYESQTLKAAIISGSGGSYGFERQAGTAISWMGSSPRFKTGFGISREPYYLPLRIDGQRNVTINAVYSYIDYDLFLGTLKNTMILVLAALGIAVFTLMVEIIVKNREASYRPAPVKTAAVPPFAEPPPVEAGEDAEDGDLFAGQAPAAGLQAEPAAPSGNPPGLYSPRGNIGWESYTRDRLDSELHRCASSEQDLTLIMAEYNGGKAGDSLFRAFAGEAVTYFTLRDLIFEKGGSGISVIIPGIDVEQGLQKSEEFHRRILNKLSGYFTRPSDLCIGLSSRAGRLIEADRIMLEAARALDKAKEDPASAIVGFKSNPDKYREFISKRRA